MSGIFDRIKPGSVDKVRTHFVDAAVFLVADGSFTQAQAREGINSLSENPLSGDELTEMTAILDNIEAEPTITAKLRYSMRVGHVFIAVESGVISSEATFKAVLGI